MMISVFDGEENIVGKGENAGNNVFKRLLSWGLLKVGIVWKRFNEHILLFLCLEILEKCDGT